MPQQAKLELFAKYESAHALVGMIKGAAFALGLDVEHWAVGLSADEAALEAASKTGLNGAGHQSAHHLPLGLAAQLDVLRQTEASSTDEESGDESDGEMSHAWVFECMDELEVLHRDIAALQVTIRSP